MVDYDYKYVGPIYRETRKFKLARDSVLKNVFAAGPWGNIIRANGSRVDAPFQPKDFRVSVTVKTVKISIKDSATTVLQGAVYTNPSSLGKLVVIFFSGSGGPLNEFAQPVIEHYLGRARSTSAMVKSVICVDYRGFGLSRAQSIVRSKTYKPTGAYLPSSKAIYTDASAVIEFATAKTNAGGLGVDPKHLILHGFSLGSGPATEMSRLGKPHSGLVLHGPMKTISHESVNAMIDMMSIGPVGGKVVYTLGSLASLGGLSHLVKIGGKIAEGNVGFQNLKKMKDIAVPVLITTGPNDSMWSGAKSLHKELKKRKKNVRFGVHDGSHLDTGAIFQNSAASHKDAAKYNGKSARDHLNEFLKEIIKNAK